MELIASKSIIPLLIERMRALVLSVTLALAASACANETLAQSNVIDPMTPDTTQYDPVLEQADYIRKELMIPMRDGVRLYTVIVMKKGTENAPIMITRTPYNAANYTWRVASQKAVDILPTADREFIEDGYIRVYQDVRGQDGSEGEYVMVRPSRGSLNATGIDHSTDAYDTIEWLVNNLSESNGNVAIQGSSYHGFTALKALIDPHPNLKAIVSMSPMVDGWIGDDWFHNGAFRQSSFVFIRYQMDVEKGGDIPFGSVDHFDAYLEAGSAGDFAARYGLDQFPAIQKMFQNPTYSLFWSEQAVDKILKESASELPTMIVMSQWEQEDNYGAPAVYAVLEEEDELNDRVSYVMGPWRHSGVLHDGSSLGHLEFGHDTAHWFRTEVMKPFLDHHLRPGSGVPNDTPPVLTFATGVNDWQTSEQWPVGQMKPLYLGKDRSLGWRRPKEVGTTNYISDPANPVPYAPRPIDTWEPSQWRTWKLSDQRFVEGRPDVAVFRGMPLSEDLHIAGSPRVDLWSSTSGTDSDWVVKLIDEAPNGSQTMLGVEIFRGRYVDSFVSPRPLHSGEVENYEFSLPHVNHVFRSGHRLVVHVQSTLFPLYDRNPQTYVENIFFAQPGDYQPAEQSITWGGKRATALYMPVVKK